MFVIEDEAHAEQLGEFPTVEAATTELRRLSELAWDQAPNVAPCTSWRTCGRRYELVQYDTTDRPWQEKTRVPALNVSAQGIDWLLL
jgi:hypothetical protein